MIEPPEPGDVLSSRDGNAVVVRVARIDPYQIAVYTNRGIVIMPSTLISEN